MRKVDKKLSGSVQMRPQCASWLMCHPIRPEEPHQARWLFLLPDSPGTTEPIRSF